MVLKETALKMARKLVALNLRVFWVVFGILTWPTRKLTAQVISIVDYLFSKTKSTVQKMLFLWSIIIMLVLISLMLYSAFYAFYVPAAEISKPVHLTFSVCSTGTGICSFPSANLTFWNEDGQVQEFLGSGQTYSVELELVMPDSRRNRNIGMFMVVIKMFDREGHVSVTSQRSVSMSDSVDFKHRSIIGRIMDTMLLGPLHFFGYLEEKKTLTVDLFSHYVDDYYHPSIGASIEIHSHVIEIHSATLKLVAKFTGLKYFLYNWPLVSTICAFWFNLVVLTTGVATVLYFRSKMNGKEKSEDNSAKLTEDSHETTKLSTNNIQGKLFDDQSKENATQPAQKPQENGHLPQIKHRKVK